MKKLKKIIIVFICIIIAALLLLCFVMRKELASALSIRNVPGSESIYTMDYKAEYDLDDLIAAEVTTPEDLISYVLHTVSHGILPSDIYNRANLHLLPACISIAAADGNGGAYFARNYDAAESGCIIVYTHPKDGYASVNLCAPEYVGFEHTQINKLSNRLACAALPYLTMDGMNEKGLAVSVEEVTIHPALPKTEKPDIMTTIVNRIVLDRCATVEEAIEMFEKYDICDVQTYLYNRKVSGPAFHYHLADASGNSAVIEFDYEDGYRLIAIEKNTDDAYQIAANHYLCEKYQNEGAERGESMLRTKNAEAVMNSKPITAQSCMDALSVSVMNNLHFPEFSDDCYCGTVWSVVYDLANRSLDLCENKNFGKVFSFDLSVD